MKTMRTRMIACLLVCAVGVACSGCGKNDGSQKETNGKAENSNAETFNSSQLAAMKQQPMQFSYAVDDEDGSVNVPVNEGVQNGNSDSNNNDGNTGGDNYVVVTDTAGQPVIDANGNTVTEPANNTGDNNSGNNNDGNNNNGDNNNGDNNNDDSSAGGNSGDTYTESITSFQAYWMDMSRGEDYVFNGDFLDVTFKIKENTPDGVYALTSGSSDFANWDAESVSCNFVDGAIAVGSASAPAAGTAQSGAFSIVAGTAQGNPGDEVTVRFDMSDNPGLVALIFRFKYDQNALEIVNAVVGSDCSDYITVSQ